ncbi:methionine ABC transporter permease, partial [Brenneria goodwinii]
MFLSLTIPFNRYIQALLDTLTMVGVSGFIAFLAGIPLAVTLIVTAPGGFLPSPRFNRIVGGVINGFRATPFIVLLVALLPFTRWVAGTTIGVWAAVVPMAISATPFFARIVEVNLREVDHGLVEAAQAMGCKKWDIVRHVYLSEALPGIVGGLTITLVALIGSSA